MRPADIWHVRDNVNGHTRYLEGSETQVSLSINTHNGEIHAPPPMLSLSIRKAGGEPDIKTISKLRPFLASIHSPPRDTHTYKITIIRDETVAILSLVWPGLRIEIHPLDHD